MKKGVLFIFLLAGGHITMHAQESKPVTISGQISTDMDSVQLIVWLANNLVTDAGGESEKITVPVGKDGRFSFTTAPISQLARLSIHDAVSRHQLFTRQEQFIAPGDQVTLMGTIHGKGDAGYFKVVFSGKGAVKYECIQALKMVNTNIIDAVSGTRNIIHAYDSLLRRKQAILNKFRERLTKNEYALIYTDMAGELKGRTLMNVCGYGLGSYLQPKPGAGELAARKKAYDDLVAHFADRAGDEAIIALSISYRKYLYLKTRAGLVFDNKGEAITLQQFFQRLSRMYTGSLRELLLGMLLLNNTENYYFFGGIDPDEYTSCLQQAYAMIQNDALKDKIRQQQNGLVKGMPAFNFTLPVDSSDTKKLSLSDLKGRVVLLDLWSYQCTGCLLFTQTFHKKIYPSFQDNPEFAVVSIMLGESSKEQYIRRLRSEKGIIYTYPDYINLFGGKGVASARKMETYHNINAFPTILLLDKQGRIYSSTLPVIYGDPRNPELAKNAEKLTALIKKALSEPAMPAN